MCFSGARLRACHAELVIRVNSSPSDYRGILGDPNVHLSVRLSAKKPSNALAWRGGGAGYCILAGDSGGGGGRWTATLSTDHPQRTPSNAPMHEKLHTERVPPFLLYR